MQYLLVTITIIGWALAFFLSKIIANRYHPGYYQIISTLTAVLILPLYYNIAKTSGKEFSFSFYDIGLGVLTFFLMNIATICLTIAYRYGNNAGIITSFSNLYIVGLMLLSTLFLGESISIKQWFGIALMLFSMFLISK
jgi:drug/metabolite transporter (DMT)-like permease